MTASLVGATIAFDLDGTLVDTAPDLVAALNATLALEGLEPCRLDAMRPMVGRGARALIEQASTALGVTFSEDRLAHLTEAFIAFYRADIAASSRPFPGCVEALDALSDAGAKLCVCTNKRTDLSVALLEALGLADRFAAIVGADAVAHRKPHPDHYRAAIERAGGRVDHSMMVGDSSADVDAALAAGRPVVVVRFGYHDRAPETLGASAVIDDYDELPFTAGRLLRVAANR